MIEKANIDDLGKAIVVTKTTHDNRIRSNLVLKVNRYSFTVNVTSSDLMITKSLILL